MQLISMTGIGVKPYTEESLIMYMVLSFSYLFLFRFFDVIFNSEF
jgi:hypothetical protein